MAWDRVAIALAIVLVIVTVRAIWMAVWNHGFEAGTHHLDHERMKIENARADNAFQNGLREGERKAQERLRQVIELDFTK